MSTGKFYGYIKSQTSVSSPISCIQRADGSLAMSDHERAGIFLEYFSSVFVIDNNHLPEFNPDTSERLEQFSCSVRDIVKIITKLKNNSSPGPDGISAVFLKKILAHIASPLCEVFSHSLAEGTLPDDWKTAHIVPIYKKGDPQQASNYRPVSLTSVIGKILEKIVRTQLLDFMLRNDVIPANQHGFLPKKSTVTNLLECLNDWTYNFDSKMATDVIYLDYSKCFDKVCHSKLLHKLEKYGITNQALQWLKGFLLDRKQYVRVNQSLSAAAEVKSGVPQGTILGPLLFVIYSADLASVVSNSKLSMYADDSKLYKSITNGHDCDLLQEDLNNVLYWAEQ
jgi:hypothetical protein